jgi:hydroxyethylthiazole kinase-like uncharacterized protein yjeF
VIPVLSVEEMRAADARALERTSHATLVARAGRALGLVAAELLRERRGRVAGARVTVLAGPGSNGADGTVAGRFLADRGAAVEVVAARPGPGAVGTGADLLIDAAYGTGFRGSYEAPELLGDPWVLACDIPSGVHGDTGAVSGRALAARATVTFAAPKPGLLQGQGAELAGTVLVADIGVDPSRARAQLLEDADLAWLPARPREAHKWQRAVAVVAGSPGMRGAAVLCARAAARAGAGMVRLGLPGVAEPSLPIGEAVAFSLPATDWAPAALTLAERCRALVLGPGLGRQEPTATAVRRVVAECPLPLVLDADALFALGTASEARALVNRRPRGGTDVLLTPHDGEASRLLGSAPGPDRLAAARRLAEASGCTCLLKGSTTVVAEPEGRAWLVTAGSPVLATAGTGDVLAGVAGAFLAAGLPASQAGALAAHAHGRAAALGWSHGLVAGDLPELLAKWLSTAERAGPAPGPLPVAPLRTWLATRRGWR